MKIRRIKTCPTRRKFVIEPECIVPCYCIGDVVTKVPLDKGNTVTTEDNSLHDLSDQVNCYNQQILLRYTHYIHMYMCNELTTHAWCVI